tara:strand:+ start:636 stop:893 length:258 start_codon:yes stop_codon:yes gene_type:complete
MERKAELLRCVNYNRFEYYRCEIFQKGGNSACSAAGVKAGRTKHVPNSVKPFCFCRIADKKSPARCRARLNETERRKEMDYRLNS